MADDDWFKPGTIPTPEPAPSNPPRRQGPSLLRLLVFSLIAFWVFSKFTAAPRGDGEVEPADRQPAPRTLPEPDIGEKPPLVPPPGMEGRSQPRETASEEPQERPMPQAKAPAQPGEESDWSIEQVDSKKKPPVDDSGVTFDPTGGAEQSSGTAKSTTKGDWTIEEVEPK